MKPGEIRELVRLRPPAADRVTRRLAAAKTVEDFHTFARRSLPRSVLDYVDGGADDEISLRGNPEAFGRWRFRPRTLVDVSAPDLSSTLLGRPVALPLGLAPTGYTRMISPLGEPAVARAAARAEIPYVLSTMATTSLEDLAAAAPGLNRWFQLYVWKDRETALGLVRRAADAGYEVLEIAVDTAVSGYRVRDVRNGFTIPPSLTLGGLADIGRRPRYWTGMLRGPALTFANLTGGIGGGTGGYTIANISDQFDPAVGWDDVERIRAVWPGRLLLKGPVGPADAARARSLGVDGVHLSNHGGRQLDRTVAPVDLIEPVREAVGPDATVIVDSGVRHGADIAVALALGADACFVGRPYLWALAAAGSPGVSHLIQLLTDQLRRTLQLTGVTSIDELRAARDLLVRE